MDQKCSVPYIKRKGAARTGDILMAEKNEESIDALRDELNTLRNQMETLVKSLGEKG